MAKTIYRMSEAGECPKVLGATRLGYERPPISPRNLRIMLESSRHEDWVIHDLRKEGYVITDQQKELVIDTPLIKLTGHIDGIIQNGDMKAHLLEVKAFGRFMFQKYQKKGISIYPHYLSQVTCYSHALGGIPIQFVVKNRDDGELDNKTQFEKPPLSFGDIVDKLHNVELCVMDGVLPEAEYEEDKCKWCDYKFLCTKVEEVEQVKEENLPTLLEAAELYNDGKLYKSMAEERMDQAKLIFLGHAKENDINKFRVSNLSFSYAGVKTRATVDIELLNRLVSQDIIEKVTKQSKPFDSYTIRIIKSD